MKKDNYNCFSYKMKEYFHRQGVGYIHHQVHFKTGRTFWVYVHDAKLTELLTNWTNRINL